MTKNRIIDIICFLFIALFWYAAVSKLLDFGQFAFTIGQNPILRPIAKPVATSVVGTEIITAILLLLPRYRRMGLYLSLGLMTIFTVFIFYVTNFASKVPCSCGGVLAKMGWTVHLYFNIAFVILAIVGIILNRKIQKNGTLTYA